MRFLTQLFSSPKLGLGDFQEFATDTAHFLSRLANEQGGVAHFKMLNWDCYLIAEPELIQEVLVKQVKSFPKEDRDINLLSRFIGRGLVTVNGEEHRQQRKMAQPAFHTRRIGAYGDVMTHYAAELAQAWQPHELRDMSQEMEKLTMYVVGKTLFDVDKTAMLEQANELGHAIKRLQLLTNDEFSSLITFPSWVPTRHNRDYKNNRAILDNYIRQLVRERRQTQFEDRGDLLSMFLQAQYEDGTSLSDDEIRDQLVTIFVAGHETTSNALTWTWYYLAQHPEVEARLHQELDDVLNGRLPTLADLRTLTYTEQVLKESMRIQPPVWTLNNRIALEDSTIGDYNIPKDSLIFISPYAMHHNPRFFPNPDQFDPDRFLPENEAPRHRYNYMPFGGGPRICIGNNFAMMEAILMLATLAQTYRFVIEPGQTVEAQYLVTVTPKNGLYMRAKPREKTAVLPSKEMASAFA